MNTSFWDKLAIIVFFLAFPIMLAFFGIDEDGHKVFNKFQALLFLVSYFISGFVLIIASDFIVYLIISLLCTTTLSFYIGAPHMRAEVVLCPIIFLLFVLMNSFDYRPRIYDSHYINVQSRGSIFEGYRIFHSRLINSVKSIL